MRSPAIGSAAIAFGIGFNIPFAILGATFDYPDILRRPPGEVLTAFLDGGNGLVLTWWAFALAAVVLIPLSAALAITSRRLSRAPALSMAAAICGALAGVTQAIGLFRWVFVVPSLARAHAESGDAATAAEHAFTILNAYGGVAIGEHLGQLLSALFVGLMAFLQGRERRRITAALGALSALLLAVGTGEGLAIALGAAGAVFGLVTVLGFLALSAWFVATGFGLTRGAGTAQSSGEQ